MEGESFHSSKKSRSSSGFKRLSDIEGHLSEITQSQLGVMRSQISWELVVAAHRGLPDFERAMIDVMGFEAFLRIEPIKLDLALIQALRERWDPVSRAFRMPWGHMVSSLDDVVRITGLRVDGETVTGVTYPDYREGAQKLLGLALEDRGSMTIARTSIMETLGLTDARQCGNEFLEEFMERTKRGSRVVYCLDASNWEY